MPIVISVANMKGGVGKTTLCVNLAFTLFRASSKRVLVVDNDPQFNATTALLRPLVYIDKFLKTQEFRTIYDIYEKPPRIGRGQRESLDPRTFFYPVWHIRNRPEVRLDLVASRLELYETLRNPSQKEYLLEKFLSQHGKDYDYVFIDCPPTPSVLTLSAFAASGHILIPVTPDYFAAHGLPQFIGTFSDFKEDLVDKHCIDILGAIFNNVPRQLTPTAVEAMQAVTDQLEQASPPIYLFKQRVSFLRVFEKALWQSRPAAMISGRGVRGKREAERQLDALATEIREKVEV